MIRCADGLELIAVTDTALTRLQTRHETETGRVKSSSEFREKWGDYPTNGRIPRFYRFPSVITSTVEANKAITPDMPGEAVSGFINIRTFNPFDTEGLGASLEVGYGEQEDRDDLFLYEFALAPRPTA